MHCPKCGKRTKVKESRWCEEESTVIRLHICTYCGRKFATCEDIIEYGEGKAILAKVYAEMNRRVRK